MLLLALLGFLALVSICLGGMQVQNLLLISYPDAHRVRPIASRESMSVTPMLLML